MEATATAQRGVCVCSLESIFNVVNRLCKQKALILCSIMSSKESQI